MTDAAPLADDRIRIIRLAIATVVLILLLGASGLHPYDRLTWVLEVAPVVVVLPVLFLTYHRFPLAGGGAALILLGRIHDRQISALGDERREGQGPG